MVSTVLRRPSVVLVTWAVIVLGLFVWRGDLSVGKAEQPEAVTEVQKEEGPVVIRRRVAPSLPRAKRIGRVFDSMGFLLVGAEVVPDDGELQKTDADGSFSVDLLTHNASDLLVRADGRRHEWLRTSAVSPDPLVICMEPDAPWDLKPNPPVGMLKLRGEGRVHGIHGKPLASAFVNVLGTDCWGLTDQSGRFEIPLPLSSATFVVHQSAQSGGVGGIASLSSPFSASRDSGIVPLPTLTGQAGGSIKGIASNARGDALPRLPVTVSGAGGVRCVQTDANGVFSISGLLPAVYDVQPFAYRGAVGESVKVRVDRAVVACDLHLSQIEESALRVIDEKGEIASGVWVAASLHGLRRGVDRAGADGVVNLPLANQTEFDVRVADSFESCSIREFDAESVPATLVISQP